ncbi:MAG: RidA family protein [Pirellulales bacterium]
METPTKNNLATLVFERDSFTEFYLTGTVDRGQATIESVETLYAEVADVLAENGIETIQEKIYGIGHAREAILATRKAAMLDRGLDPALPLTYVDGRPIDGSDFAGIHLWGIVPHGPNQTVTTTFDDRQRPAGRLWAGDDFRLLYLPFVRGEMSDGSLHSCVTGQAQRVFQNATAALSANGFSYAQVVRTWIYAARLLDWYGELNRVRTVHHDQAGLRKVRDRTVFPASTGIQGRSLDEECFMDVLAVDADESSPLAVRPIQHTSRQGQAFSYGSAFSRGMVFDIEQRRTVYVSGTASINPAGDTVYVGNPEAQSMETLLNLAAVLEVQGGSLRDICSAVVYCKNRETLDAYRTIAQLLRIPEFPAIYVEADVCRSDLLIEIEAVAVI